MSKSESAGARQRDGHCLINHSNNGAIETATVDGSELQAVFAAYLRGFRLAAADTLATKIDGESIAPAGPEWISTAKHNFSLTRDKDGRFSATATVRLSNGEQKVSAEYQSVSHATPELALAWVATELGHLPWAAQIAAL